MKQLFVAVAVVAALAACGSGSAERPEPDSGIEGRVLAGPQCPVAQASSPCPDATLAATIDAVNADGSEKTTFEAEEDGSFRVPLEPGDYRIEPQPIDPSRPFPAPIPQSVTVAAHEFVEITIRYDTGIR